MKQSLTAYIHSAFGTAVATGALAGAASGAIMTGTLQGTLKGALFGAISAGVAYGIGHGGGLFAKVRQYGGSLGKATLHGISRAAISKLQTGSGKGGFLSGFASSILGGVVNNIQTASTTLKVAAAAIAGGTASAIGGGKFANGAMSGAFIMLFNDLKGTMLNKARDSAVDTGSKKVFESLGINKSMTNILGDGVKGLAGGAVAGTAVAGFPVGTIAGGILGIGGGLVTGAALESFGINSFIENTIDTTKLWLYDFYEGATN